MSFLHSLSSKEESTRLLSLIRRNEHSHEELKSILKELVLFLHFQCHRVQRVIAAKRKEENDKILCSSGKNVHHLVSGEEEDGSIGLLRTASVLVGAFCRKSTRPMLSLQENTITPLFYYGEGCGIRSSTRGTAPSTNMGDNLTPSMPTASSSFSSPIFQTSFVESSIPVNSKLMKNREHKENLVIAAENQKGETDHTDTEDNFRARHCGNESSCSCLGSNASLHAGSNRYKGFSVGEVIHWLATSSCFSFLLHRPVYSQKHDILVLTFFLQRLAQLSALLSIPTYWGNASFHSSIPTPLVKGLSADRPGSFQTTVVPLSDIGATPCALGDRKISELQERKKRQNHGLLTIPKMELHSMKGSPLSSSAHSLSLNPGDESEYSFHSSFSPCSLAIASALAYGLGELLDYNEFIFRRAKKNLSRLLTSVTDASSWNVSEIIVALMDISFLFSEENGDFTCGMCRDGSSLFFSPVHGPSLNEACFPSSKTHPVGVASLRRKSAQHALVYSSTLFSSTEREDCVVCRTPLHCPFTFTLVQYPARGRQCRHFQFFDAYHFVLAVMQSFSPSSSATAHGSSSTCSVSGLFSGTVEHPHHHPTPMVHRSGVRRTSSATTTRAITRTPPDVRGLSLACAGGPCPFCREYVRIDELFIDFRVLRAMGEAKTWKRANTTKAQGEEVGDKGGNSASTLHESLSPTTHVVEWVADSPPPISLAVESDEDVKEENVEEGKQKKPCRKVCEKEHGNQGNTFSGFPSGHWSAIPALHYPPSNTSEEFGAMHEKNGKRGVNGENPCFLRCCCRIVKQVSCVTSAHEREVVVDEGATESREGMTSFFSSILPSSYLSHQETPTLPIKMELPVDTPPPPTDTSYPSTSSPPPKRRRVDIAGHVLYVDE